MRLVFMGTGPFAVPSFQAIAGSGKHEILTVWVRPQASTASGKPPQPHPVERWAKEGGWMVEQPESANSDEAVARLQLLQPDLLVVCDYGQILSPATLAAARLGGINLHGSLLPRHRGAAPVAWAVLQGDPQVGISVIHMTPRLDGGPVLVMRSTSLGSSEDASQLESRLSLLGVDATLEAIAMLESQQEHAKGQVQDKQLATRARRLTKADAAIDWSFPAEKIDRLIRGLQPWPGAYGILEVGGKELRLQIRRAAPRAARPDEAQGVDDHGSQMPGQWVFGWTSGKSPSRVWVCCGSGWLELLDVQPAGKNSLAIDAFLRGYYRNATMHFLPPATPSPALLEMSDRNSM
ncbi:MAG: methionyl-tRNA formyltransferase [Pirellulaceae bacterium]